MRTAALFAVIVLVAGLVACGLAPAETGPTAAAASLEPDADHCDGLPRARVPTGSAVDVAVPVAASVHPEPVAAPALAREPVALATPLSPTRATPLRL